MEICSECNEHAVEKDQYYSQEQLVCKACGAVFSEDSFTNESGYVATSLGYFNEKQSNTLPWKIQKEGCKTIPAGEKISLQKLDLLVSAFSVPAYMKSEASELLKMALKHPTFVKLHVEKKKALAACCIYVIFRRNNWPIMISSLCNLVQVDLKSFNDVFQSLLSEFHINLTTTPIEELVSFYLKDANIENKEHLIDKCISIIELARDVWIVRGIKPNGVISAVVYLAWMAERIDQRCKTSYKQFCQLNKLAVEPSGPLRFKELFNMFTVLTEKLPWIQKKNLNKKEVLYSLDNVLKYSKTLLVQSDDAEENWDQFLSKRKKFKIDEQPQEIIGELKVSNSSELTEDDIPSSEMHEYVRSAEEIKQLETILAKHSAEV